MSSRALVLMSLVAGASLATTDCSACRRAAMPDTVVFPADVTMGERCDGLVYVTLNVGYAFCEEGAWAWSDVDLATLGEGYVNRSSHAGAGIETSASAGTDGGS